MQSENQIAYYAGARWSDRSPRMIASLLVETLAGTGSCPAVIGPGTSARMDQALVGDTVDNIPGIAGVGPKAAIALLTRFGSLDGIYADLDAVLAMPVRGAKRLRKLLDEQRDAAERSRKLARIVTDIPLECAVERLQWPGCPPADADSLLRETGLGTGAISRLLDACASAVAA